jgi:hypothetical protein
VDQAAVLLMDSTLPHTSERILRSLGENNIIALTFPAHTTNSFQTLDLVFFGSLKHLKATAAGEFWDDSANDHITKLIQAYEQTATSSTIRGSEDQRIIPQGGNDPGHHYSTIQDYGGGGHNEREPWFPGNVGAKCVR